MLDRELIRAALARVQRPADAFADLFAEQSTYSLYQETNGELQVRKRIEQGIGMRRVQRDYHTSQHAHTPDLSEEGLSYLVRLLRDETALPKAPQYCAALTSPASTYPADIRCRISATTAEARRWLGLSPQASITTTVRIVERLVLVGSVDGPIFQEERNYATLQVEVVIRQKQKVRKSRRLIGAVQCADLWREDRHLALAREAAESALRRMEAVQVPSGEIAVILGPGGPAVLLHEACGHALEADLALQSGSAYHARLGEQVASPDLTIIDDPTPSQTGALYHFDDEGEPAQATVLIERGILRNYLYDRCRASADRPSNGHARRLSYAYQPLPRMSTTYAAPGKCSAQEIVAETPKGILVQSILGGDTDMGSGRFHLQVEEGYLIEHGRITAPIHGAVLSGLGPQVLRSIDRVGDDCQFLPYGYTCNKLDQFPLVVSVGQPTLRVAGLHVWGG